MTDSPRPSPTEADLQAYIVALEARILALEAAITAALAELADPIAIGGVRRVREGLRLALAGEEPRLPPCA